MVKIKTVVIILKIIANFAAHRNFAKTQLHKIGQSGWFLGIFLGSLLKIGFALIGNLINPLTKSVLITLGLIAAAAAKVVAIHNKMLGFGRVAKISGRDFGLDKANNLNNFEWRSEWFYENS